jgi:hypothetical protein
MEENWLFRQTVQDPILREKVELASRKIGRGSPYAHRTQLISHNPTSVSSGMSNIVCWE